MALQRRLRLVDSVPVPGRAAAIKVAFATSDLKKVDQHFGAAQAFAIYALEGEQSRFIEACEFAPAAMDGNEDKLGVRIRALEGCSAVYSQAIGASAIRQLHARGIQPMKPPPNALIGDLLASLLQLDAGDWLFKSPKGEAPDDLTRFDVMEAEGWEE